MMTPAGLLFPSAMSDTAPHSPEGELRPHAYDGIREYDKRLPNWWLWTFYLTIIFSVVYWFYYHTTRVGPDDATRVERELSRIEAVKLAAVGNLSDNVLWQMSRNPAFVEAGKATYAANCASCHLASLRGRDENPVAVGVNLADSKWIHGGKPIDIFGTVDKGVAAKGMPTWGPLLGTKKVTEVVAYVLNHHDSREEVLPDTSSASAAAVQ